MVTVDTIGRVRRAYWVQKKKIKASSASFKPSPERSQASRPLPHPVCALDRVPADAQQVPARVLAGTCGNTGHPPGSLTLLARDRWKASTTVRLSSSFRVRSKRVELHRMEA